MATSTTATVTPSETGVINRGNANYKYIGCWSETSTLNQTGGHRALYDGAMESLDTMTVDVCLNFCYSQAFTIAGLEYQTECWCASYLSSFSQQLSDSECNLACKGNSSELCGGSLRLSAYQKGSKSSSRAPRLTNIPRNLFVAGLVITGLVLEML